MQSLTIRSGSADDLPRLTAIYNHYVEHTSVTFDLNTFTVAERGTWLAQFNNPRHQLLVAEHEGVVMGYASSSQFRYKSAYDNTVESTIYLAPEATGHGLGRQLYTQLLDTLGNTDVHTVIAVVTLPNPASIALHEALGFIHTGVLKQVGYKFGQFWDTAWLQRGPNA